MATTNVLDRAVATTAVRERGIIFSAPMVRAILAGRKTQTRRIVTDFRNVAWTDPTPGCEKCTGNPTWGRTLSGWTRCPKCVRPDTSSCHYGRPGDRLWVRETWTRVGVVPFFRADEIDRQQIEHLEVPWRSPIHLPRCDARITLEITGVRVERVQSITEADAVAEGITGAKFGRGFTAPGVPLVCADGTRAVDLSVWVTAREAFQKLWEHINGPDSWAANPWVWAVSFCRLESTHAG